MFAISVSSVEALLDSEHKPFQWAHGASATPIAMSLVRATRFPTFQEKKS